MVFRVMGEERGLFHPGPRGTKDRPREGNKLPLLPTPLPPSPALPSQRGHPRPSPEHMSL